MKYILNFNDHSQFINKEEPYDNLVSLCKIQDHIHYGQDNDKYKNECFSIKLLSGFNATIQIKYDPSITSNNMWISTVPVRCNEETEEIYMSDAAGHDSQISGNNGLFEINNLNEGDQIWICTIDETNAWTETDANSNTIQHGHLEFKMIDCTVSLQGNIMSLFAPDSTDFMSTNFTTSFYNYMCHCMFKGRNTEKTLYGSTTTEGNDSIIYAHNLILPLNALPTYAYSSMFSGCFSLKSIPRLLATTLGAACYYYMFYGCLSLEDISYLELPATSLPNNCYRAMFDGCRSLRYPMKEIHGTASGGTGASTYNLYRLFYYCTSLEKAPKVELGTVGKFECTYMFRSCTSLKSIDKFSHTGTAGQYGFAWMCEYASSLAYFPPVGGKYTSQHHYNRAWADTALEKIKINIPTLYQYQFYYSFRNCTKLSYIDATEIKDRSNTACTNSWLNGAKNTTDCKLYTYHGTTWPTTSASSYLSNWTVYDENGTILRQP